MKTKEGSYLLVDSGCGRKLERFGPYLIDRPCTQAVWQPKLSSQDWKKADVRFTREDDESWTGIKLPGEWIIELENINLKLSSTDFGHLGVFPEHAGMWTWFRNLIKQRILKSGQPPKILNLFAYSGGATLAAAAEGAEVCHVDASKGMIDWARQNAFHNNLEKAPIRWIVDDVNRFLNREIRRGNKYDAIILDPPTFGRGKRGEVFKIERDLQQLLKNCRTLLTEDPLFVLFSCHTPGFTPMIMRQLLMQTMENISGKVEEGEMSLPGVGNTFSVPSGTFSRWSCS
ncbi:MAG: 23S rRNA (cytosine1962-C5)-methyltransferase [Chlamydiales bacterium]|jgi:23S rRNA (cytosine1962-C5)-methyltransferase